MINKIGRPRSGSPIFLITSMIIDRIGQHEVLLPIDHDFKKNCDIEDSFWTQNTRNSKIFLPQTKKESYLSARVMACTIQLLKHDAMIFPSNGMASGEELFLR